MRQALAGMLCPVVRRRPLVVGRRNVDRLCATAHPQLVALLEAQGDGVVGVLEGDMAVIAHGDCFPDCQVVRRWRQRLEPRPLGFVKTDQRLLLGRAVHAQPGGTKAHLAFLARATLDPHHDLRLRRRLQAVHEPAHGRVTTAVTALQQTLKDGRHFDPFLAQLLDRRTVRFHRRAVLWRLGFAQRLVYQLLQPGQRGERGFRQQPLLRGPGPVPFHGLPMHSGCPLHHTVLVALPHLQHQFADVHGLFSPVRHRPSQLPATCSAGKDTGCAGVAPSAWYTLADYSRYTLADYGWYTLADSRWYSIARLLTRIAAAQRIGDGIGRHSSQVVGGVADNFDQVLALRPARRCGCATTLYAGVAADPRSVDLAHTFLDLLGTW